MKRHRGIALITCVALMSLLSSGLLTLTLLAKQDVVRTRRVTDGAQLRQVLMAVAAQADAAIRAGDTLPTEWSVPTELDVKVETFWRENTDDPAGAGDRGDLAAVGGPSGGDVGAGARGVGGDGGGAGARVVVRSGADGLRR